MSDLSPQKGTKVNVGRTAVTIRALCEHTPRRARRASSRLASASYGAPTLSLRFRVLGGKASAKKEKTVVTR
jgi:hypothetical protein